MKKKIFLVLFSVILIFSVFTLSVSAESSTDYHYSLQEFLTFYDGQISTYYRDKYDDLIECSYSFPTENSIYFGAGGNFFGLYANSYGSGTVGSSDVVVFDAENFFFEYAPVGSPDPNNVILEIRLGGGQVLGSTTDEIVLARVAASGYTVAGSYVQYEFDIPAFTSSIPAGVSMINNIWINVYCPESKTDIGASLVCSDITYYVGPSEHAPLYSGADSGALDDYESAEHELIDATSGGMSEITSLTNNLRQAFVPSSSIYQGTMFFGNLLSDLVGTIPDLNMIVLVSLALGIVTIIIGLGSEVAGRRIGRENYEARSEARYQRRKAQRDAERRSRSNS